MTRHPEHDAQAALIQWAALNTARYPVLRWLHAIPNAAKRSPHLAAYMKAEGLKAGVPDLFLPCARNNYHGLYIEMKHGTNKPSPDQREFLDFAAEQGFLAVVCYSWDEAREAIEEYLETP